VALMAFDFPASPTVGAIYSPAGGPSWQWNGTTWIQVTGSTSPPVPLTALDHNMVINPGIQISQEWATNVSYSGNGVYFADQWITSYNGPTGGTHMQYAAYLPSDLAAPVGLLQIVGRATAYTSIAAGNYASFAQYLEGTQVAQLAWGTVNASPAVLAFEAYCSVAGTYSVSMRSSNADRSIAFPITIAAGEVSTWKKFTFAVPATTSGTFTRDNTYSCELRFTVMVGSTLAAPSSGAWLAGNYYGLAGQSNMLATINQSFSVRAVGLYPDPGGTGLAPPFQMPDYASELVKCQRYWQQVSTYYAGATTSTALGFYTYSGYTVPPRAAPSLSGVSQSANNFAATTGTLTNLVTGVRELRTSNAAGPNSSYYSSVTVIARM
jgi:hypothetical protein